MSREELQRRCGFLAAKALPSGLPGKQLCRWCGTPKNGFDALRLHYFRHHADDVRHEPAGTFGDGAGVVASRKARPRAEAFVEANPGAFKPGGTAAAKATKGKPQKGGPAAGAGDDAAGEGTTT